MQSGQPVLLHNVPEHLRDLLERSCEHLDQEQRKQVTALLIRYQDVFSKGDGDLGRTNLVKHSIDTGDSKPVRQPYRRLPQSQQEEAGKQVQEMLPQGIITPSASPWARAEEAGDRTSDPLSRCVF